jgi:hypothetical protein
MVLTASASMPVPSDWSEKLRAFVAKLKADPHRPLGDEPFDAFVLTEPQPAASWEAFLHWCSELDGSWCFRGQREANWLLHPSQDLSVLVEYSSGHHRRPRKSDERELLFQFKQRAHQYIKNLPSSSDLSSWLALMQHHGVPTRFLDWTTSPYVGMYFAIEEEPREQPRRSAIWAISLDWLRGKARELLPPATSDPHDPAARADYVNTLLEQVEKPVIVSIDPQHTDERMVAQQGLFLCKLIPEATFNQILMTMMIHPNTPERPVVRKLEVDANSRIDFLKRLRAMNIHRASLFPGLDGFCQFLKVNSEIKSKDAAQDAELSISDLGKMLEDPAAEPAGT